MAGILGFARPAVNALGGPASLGPTGMELDWPYLDPALNLDTIVAKQTAQKTEIASVKVKILKGSQAIDTYAGGTDVSYQLIRRSRTEYREAYLRILAICLRTRHRGRVRGAASRGGRELARAHRHRHGRSGARVPVRGQSSLVEDATGAPATVDLVSPTEFARLGGLADLYPPAYGTPTSPAPRRPRARSPSTCRACRSSGRRSCRAIPTSCTNSEGAAWHEDGPFPISAEDVAKLGQNVAIWGMGTGATTAPKGIVKSTLT